jgi:hypothetical protein
MKHVDRFTFFAQSIRDLFSRIDAINLVLADIEKQRILEEPYDYTSRLQHFWFIITPIIVASICGILSSL